MNEARRLDPEVMSSAAPSVATPLVVAPSSPAVEMEAVHRTATLASPSQNKNSLISPPTRTAERLESTSRSLLLYFVIGLFAFAAGAAMASAMLFGWLDLEWVKDALKSVKELVRNMTSGGS